jgi:hypothetical protein
MPARLISRTRLWGGPTLNAGRPRPAHHASDRLAAGPRPLLLPHLPSLDHVDHKAGVGLGSRALAGPGRRRQPGNGEGWAADGPRVDDVWILTGAALAAATGLWLIILALTPSLRHQFPLRVPSDSHDACTPYSTARAPPSSCATPPCASQGSAARGSGCTEAGSKSAPTRVSATRRRRARTHRHRPARATRPARAGPPAATQGPRTTECCLSAPEASEDTYTDTRRRR